jgi:O-antigen/teichoic acid export membrane protein
MFTGCADTSEPHWEDTAEIPQAAVNAMSTTTATGPAQACPATIAISDRLVARNTAANLVGRALPLLVGMVTTPYVVRGLGADRFGLLSLTWILTGYFALFDLGIGPAVTKFVAEELGRDQREHLSELVGTAIASQIVLGILAGCCWALMTPWLAGELLKIPPGLRGQAEQIFWMLAATMPLGFAGGSLEGVLAAAQRFDLLNAVGVPASAINYLLPAIGVAVGLSLPAIVALLVGARIVSTAVAYALCVRTLPELRRMRIRTPLVRRLLAFGGWVTTSGVVGPILVYFDRFLIATLLSVGALGYYAPPYMVTSKLTLFATSLVAALFPAFSSLAGAGNRALLEQWLVRGIRWILLATAPAALLLACFARAILALWIGKEFALAGERVLEILALGLLLNALAHVPYAFLQGCGRPDLTAKFHLLEVPVHVVLAWVLVTHYALAGAALAWSLRVALDFLLLYLAACRLTKTPWSAAIRGELAGAVAAVVLLGAGLAVERSWLHGLGTHLAVALVLVSLFAIVVWRHALSEGERWIIRQWWKQAR